MKKRLVQSLILAMFLLGLLAAALHQRYSLNEEIKEIIKQHGYNIGESPFAGSFDIDIRLMDVTDTASNGAVMVAEEEPEVIDDTRPEIEKSWVCELYLKMGYPVEEFYRDINLLCAIVDAEAGNQSEYGRRLVADTVINRIWSDNWRDDMTIREVITHPGQYDTYSNGAYNRVSISEDTRRIVEEEIIHQTNEEVIYFKTNGYFAGVPSLLQEGDHYFSGDASR